MALTTLNLVVRGVDQEVIDWDSGNDLYILKNNLTSFDMFHLNAMDASIDNDEINNLPEAADEYTMPNGMTGTQYYLDNYVFDVNDVNDAFVPRGVSSVVWEAVKDIKEDVATLRDDLDNLEGRVDVLENL